MSWIMPESIRPPSILFPSVCCGDSQSVLVFVLPRLFPSKTSTSVNINIPQQLRKLSCDFTLRPDICLSLWHQVNGLIFRIIRRLLSLSLSLGAPSCSLLRWADCLPLYRFPISIVFEAEFGLLLKFSRSPEKKRSLTRWTDKNMTGSVNDLFYFPVKSKCFQVMFLLLYCQTI